MVGNVEYIRAKTGSEIARELDISRQAVSQSLKRAISKVYKGLREERVTETPTETVMFMRDWFGVEDEEDIVQFFELFTNEIQDEIREHARTYTIGE